METPTLKTWTEQTLRLLVDFPDRVELTATQGERTLILEAAVDPSDYGKVLGRQAEIIKAIRRLLFSMGRALDTTVVFELREGGGRCR